MEGQPPAKAPRGSPRTGGRLPAQPTQLRRTAATAGATTVLFVSSPDACCSCCGLAPVSKAYCMELLQLPGSVLCFLCFSCGEATDRGTAPNAAGTPAHAAAVSTKACLLQGVAWRCAACRCWAAGMCAAVDAAAECMPARPAKSPERLGSYKRRNRIAVT